MIDLKDLDTFLNFATEELLLDSSEINPLSEFRTLRTWSSLNALVLISRINDESDVMISSSQLANCKTVQDIHQLIIAG